MSNLREELDRLEGDPSHEAEARRIALENRLGLMRRWYVRCIDCLGVAATHERPGIRWACVGWRVDVKTESIGADLTTLECAACGGKMELMGRVEKDETVVETRKKSACDCRCTHAAGPLCNCQCKDKNHGAGLVVEVVYKTTVAPSILVCMEPAAAIERAKAYAAASVAAEKSVSERFADVLRFDGPRYKMSRELYAGAQELNAARRKLRKIFDIRDHAKRLEKLARFAEELTI